MNKSTNYIPNSSEIANYQEELIELYSFIKEIEEINQIDEDKQKSRQEKLRKLKPHTIISYIKSSIRIIIDMKAQSAIEEYKTNNPSELRDESIENSKYEELLMRLESNIRNHIRVRIY